ncbi:hypothetical protein BSKO_01879 [Bryopsis sp. KO-2023]|nr:hypothetical protein BSKO_01879 [Bryopsis sp. KO-2023]
MRAALFSHLRRSRSFFPELAVGDTRLFTGDTESSLTPFLFTGRIHYADTPEGAKSWCGHIQSHGFSVIGLDSEWKPERRRGENNPIALLQMSYRKQGQPEVLLVHTAFTGIPAELQDILTDESIVKVGANLKQDKAKLQFHFGVELKGAYDLSFSKNKILRGFASPNKTLGIKQLVAKLLGKKLKKDLTWQRSRWDKRPLQRQQMEYAALDAYGPLAVYEKLKEMELRAAPVSQKSVKVSPLDKGPPQPQ